MALFKDNMLSPYSLPGYQTDTINCRDPPRRRSNCLYMDERFTEDFPRPRLRLYYADKIYNASNLIIAAWSRLRHGPVAIWQALKNSRNV